MWPQLLVHNPTTVQFNCAQVGTQGRWVPLGDSLAIIKQHKASFPGPFRIPSNILTLYSPLSMYSESKIQDGILLSFKQWPKGLPGRRRLHEPINNVCHTLCIRLCHYNKINSLTHSLFSCTSDDDDNRDTYSCFVIHSTIPSTEFGRENDDDDDPMMT